MTRAQLLLDGEWTVEHVSGPDPLGIGGRPLRATVPGSVHADLLAAGLIDDPYDGDNETRQLWIGRTSWRWRRVFQWSPDGHTRHDLVLDGVDTVATIALDGRPLGTVGNQHRRHRIDLTALLDPGPHELTVLIEAPRDHALRTALAHGGDLPRSPGLATPIHAIRKMASGFGWDWGVDVATSGLWRSVRIEGWTGSRIASVRPLVGVIGADGLLDVHVELEQEDGASSVPVQVVVTRTGTSSTAEASISRTGSVSLVVPQVERWWPIGYGRQPLYDVVVTTADDEWQARVGFRTVRLLAEPDEVGTSVQVLVNDRPVLVRGVNWIPDDALLRVGEDRYARRLADAVEANVNLLRIWGGGLYESDDLYDRCDEAGVLVWQDFAFACSAYPEEDWLAREVDAEAREAVTRLSRHPSLVVWNGSNECVWGHAEWGWRPRLAGRSWGEGYYLRRLPGILAELDPTRPYLPSSPWSFLDHVAVNDDRHGMVHLWDVWGEQDYPAYRAHRPRFVSEFGFQGPPAWTTLAEVLHDEPMYPPGPLHAVHQKAIGATERNASFLARHVETPATPEDWHFAASLLQAWALRTALEHFRALAPHCTGAIVWQLNDDWPVVSWSLVDHAERRKPAWYAVRAAYRPRMLTLQPDGDGLVLVALNDTDQPWRHTAQVRRLRLDGTVLAAAQIPVEVAARRTARRPLDRDVAAARHPNDEVLVASWGTDPADRAFWDYAEVRDQHLDPAPVSVSAEPLDDGALVRVTAHGYTRDLTVLADRADPTATADVSLVSLLPGDVLDVRLRAAGPVPADRASRPDVVRHANQLVRASASSPTRGRR